MNNTTPKMLGRIIHQKTHHGNPCVQALTDRLTLTVCDELGPVPCTIAVYVPAATLQGVVNVRTEDVCPLGGGVTVCVENDAVIPAGRPVTDRETGLLNPLSDWTLTIVVFIRAG